MTPYYSDDLVTIYHADNRDVEWPGHADLVLTDPPYGIDHPTDYSSRKRGRLAKTRDFDRVAGDSERFDPRNLLAVGPCILWGANYYAGDLPTTGSWLVWDKRVREGVGVNDQADGELAWSNATKGVRIFRHMWNGMWRDSERGQSYHPTQKPAALMSWCLSKAKLPSGALIFDPYMGGGPVAVAAKAFGYRYTGIEIEERYCEIAAKRCAQEVLGLDAA